MWGEALVMLWIPGCRSLSVTKNSLMILIPTYKTSEARQTYHTLVTSFKQDPYHQMGHQYDPLSCEEESRLQRGFYRYELYTQIFGSNMEYRGEKLWELSEIRERAGLLVQQVSASHEKNRSKLPCSYIYTYWRRGTGHSCRKGVFDQ